MLEQTDPFELLPGHLPLIEFRDVSLTVNQDVLIHNIKCKIFRAGITVIMGPNGAGKTLFLRLLSGLLSPTTGEIIRNSQKTGKENNPSIAMLFQQPVLLRRTTYKNIEFVLRHFKFPASQIAKEVNNALVKARLEDRARVPARQLSGGERQRLALARSLVVKPDILLLDEVTASLDPASAAIVENLVVEAANTGTKVIFITHDVRQAKRIADDVLFIHGGRVLMYKPVPEFFKEPGSPQAQAYLDGRVFDQSYRSEKIG